MAPPAVQYEFTEEAPTHRVTTAVSTLHYNVRSVMLPLAFQRTSAPAFLWKS